MSALRYPTMKTDIGSFHIISNHSARVASFGNQLDYLGIVILMWGSTIPTVYYGFYCQQELQTLYFVMVRPNQTIWIYGCNNNTQISILGLACAITTLNPRFRHPTLRPYRAAMYAFLGLSAIVFIIHGIFLYGWETQSKRMSLDRMGLMAILNLVGACIYAARVSRIVI